MNGFKISTPAYSKEQIAASRSRTKSKVTDETQQSLSVTSTGVYTKRLRSSHGVRVTRESTSHKRLPSKSNRKIVFDQASGTSRRRSQRTQQRPIFCMCPSIASMLKFMRIGGLDHQSTKQSRGPRNAPNYRRSRQILMVVHAPV